MPSDLPAKTELTVLDAGNPGTPIGFTVHEYAGVEIYTTGRTLTPDEISALSEEDCRTIIYESEGETLDTPESMQEGLLILIPGMMGGYHFGIVKHNTDGSWGWESPSGTLIGILEFDTDDRHCWTCGGMANLKSLMKLNLELE